MLHFDSDVLPAVQDTLEDSSDETKAQIVVWANLALDWLAKSFKWRQLRGTVDTTTDETYSGSDSNGKIQVPTENFIHSGLYPVDDGWTTLPYTFYERTRQDLSEEHDRRTKYYWLPAATVFTAGSESEYWYLYEPDGTVYEGDVLWDFQIKHPAVVSGSDSPIAIPCRQSLMVLIMQWALRNSKYDVDARSLELDLQKALRLEIGMAGQGKKEVELPGRGTVPPLFAAQRQKSRGTTSTWGAT